MASLDFCDTLAREVVNGVVHRLLPNLARKLGETYNLDISAEDLNRILDGKERKAIVREPVARTQTTCSWVVAARAGKEAHPCGVRVAEGMVYCSRHAKMSQAPAKEKVVEKAAATSISSEKLVPPSEMVVLDSYSEDPTRFIHPSSGFIIEMEDGKATVVGIDRSDGKGMIASLTAREASSARGYSFIVPSSLYGRSKPAPSKVDVVAVKSPSNNVDENPAPLLKRVATMDLPPADDS